MKQVVALHHRGVRCAIPAQQALEIGEGTCARPELMLWPARKNMSSSIEPRAITVQTRAGLRCLRCVDPQLVELPRSAVCALPDLVKRGMALPHVVGLAELEGRALWLVDLTRFENAGPIA